MNLDCDFAKDGKEGNKDRILPSTSKARAKKRSRKAGGFECRARDIVASVNELRTFLVTSRDFYLSSMWTGDGEVKRGTDDRQRDNIDAGANRYS
jgi:hypothetical protein